MIVQEQIELDDRIFIRTYSTSGFIIIQDESGELYDEALDPAETQRTYTESDILITDEKQSEESDTARAEDYEDALRRLGADI